MLARPGCLRRLLQEHLGNVGAIKAARGSQVEGIGAPVRLRDAPERRARGLARTGRNHRARISPASHERERSSPCRLRTTLAPGIAHLLRTISVVIVGIAAPALAHAHERGLSRAELRVAGARITAELVFARPEIVELVPGADADRSGQLDELELLSVETLLSEQVLTGIHIFRDTAACPGTVEKISFVEEDGLSVAVGFACPGPLDAFTLRLPLLGRLAPGHRLLGHVVFQDMSSQPGVPELDFVAHRRRSALTIRRPELATTSTPEPGAASKPAAQPIAIPEPAPARPRWPWLVLAAAPVGLAVVFLLRRRRPA